MEEDKKPVHGQLRIDEKGDLYIWKDNRNMGKATDTITPDSIRDKEMEDLRRSLRDTKRLNWIIGIAAFIAGVIASWLIYLIL